MKHIEIFEHIPEAPLDAPPLLFVHGACLGAWCWRDHFLDFFAGLGYQAIALNLRAHGGSESEKQLQDICLDDYVEDVVSVASKLSGPPIVVGHSMGGLIAQRFAQQIETAGVILMAPSPLAGMQSQAGRLFKAHPWVFLKATLKRNIYYIYPDNRRVRQIMFSPETSEAIVTACRERLQKESWRVSQEMSDPVERPYTIHAPMLVVGGEMDGTVLPETICDTAVAYNAPCHIFPGLGHNLMLEDRWQEVATYLHRWLKNNVVGN